MASYYKPDWLTSYSAGILFNPSDFKGKSNVNTDGTAKMAMPTTDKGVTYYKTADKKLYTNSNFLYTDSTGVLFLAGKLGLNKTTPTRMLHVNGDSQFEQLVDCKQNVNVAGLTTTNKLRVTGQYPIIPAEGNIVMTIPAAAAARINDYPLQIISTEPSAGRRTGICFANQIGDPSIYAPDCDITFNAYNDTQYYGALEFNFGDNIGSGSTYKRTIMLMDFNQISLKKDTTVTGNFTVKNAAAETVALIDSSTATINKPTTVNAYLQGNSISSLGFLSSYDATTNTNRFYVDNSSCLIRNYTGWNTPLLFGWMCVDTSNEGRKIILYDQGYDPNVWSYYGFGISSGSLDYNTWAGGSHTFYSEFAQVMKVNSTDGLVVPNKCLLMLPSTYPNYLGTGNFTSVASGAAKLYPLCIYGQTGTINQRRIGIAFCDNTNADDIPGANISYVRRNAAFDQGDLMIDGTLSYASPTNLWRTNIAIFNTSLIYLNRKVILGEINGTPTIPTVYQSRLNLNTNVLESKICLYDAGTAGTMCGMGVNTNAFAFQVPSTSYVYNWRYGGTNNDGTQLMQLKWVTALGNLTTTAGPGLGIGVAPSYQIHLNVDSAGKPNGSSWASSSDIRLKENIELADLDRCYNDVKNLKLKRFRWKDETYTDEQINDRNVIGWIAQDVELIMPKAVTKMNLHGYEDCRSLQPDQIFKAQYGATQKLIEKVETLENTVALLLEKISLLESLINKS